MNVAALIVKITKKGTLHLLLGQRRDYPECWQWPQGGVDEGESLEEALHREIREETGLQNIDIVEAFKKPIRYEFSKKGLLKFAPFIGQEQYYFIVKVPASEWSKIKGKEVNNKEFIQLDWKEPQVAVATAPAFKKKAYKAALKTLENLCMNHRPISP